MAKEYSMEQIASQVRRDIVRMVTNAASGHPGGSMSSTDIMTWLYFKELDAAPENWQRSGRNIDMFFLSAGHMTPVFYSVLSRRGYFPVEELSTFRLFGTRLQGHPCIEKGLPGIHQAAGSLGQGLSVALGAAMAKKLDGDSHRVFCLIGDGESEEGQIWEAAMSAAHQKADNLVAITDWNHKQIDGDTEDVAGLGNLEEKWKAFGWEVIVAEGHCFKSIENAFSQARAKGDKGRPVMILFKTEMGHGVDFMAGTHKWHGKNPSQEQCDQAMAQLEETLGDF
ncbi:MAG: transketolase [Bacteroidales bacterium]|nr:transketolase [Candidatus Cacconaster caballi]